MSLARMFRHMFAPPVSRAFDDAALERLAGMIAEDEARHRGEVVFAVEGALPAWDALRGVPARARAEAAFATLRVWDTEANTGVLLYLLLADRRIEIVADRGLAAVAPEHWREVCALIEARMAAGEAEAAVVAGLQAIGGLLAAACPRADGVADTDELANRPHVLG